MKDPLLSFRERLRKAWPHARAVAADPQLRISWLKSARAAQVALALTIFLGVLLVPPAADGLVETVLPSRTTRSFFRRRVRRHPAADLLSGMLSGCYWLGGLGTTAALLVLHAPKVLSGRREDAGDVGNAQTMIAAPAGPPEEVNPLAATMAPAPAPDAAAPAPAPAPETEAAPTPPARYTIRGELGRGGMGVVYEAMDSVLEREVALKVLRKGRLDPSARERFVREARVLARLRHAGIVQVYDLADTPDGLWIAIELVRGGGLDDQLKRSGKLPLPRACAIGAALADTLAYAHGEGVVHRDFKPGNVLLTESGDPKVTDFGLAKLLAEGPKLTQLGSVLGSPGYMSPEQASGGEVDARADVYAFGVTLFEMLTGRCPFEGDTASVLAAHITQTPPTPGELGTTVPDALTDLLKSLLAKRADERPSDMEGVATALRLIGAGAD